MVKKTAPPLDELDTDEAAELDTDEAELDEPAPDPDAEPGADELVLTDDGQPDPGDDRELPRGAKMPAGPLDLVGGVTASTRAAIATVVAAAEAAGLPLALVWGKSSTGEHAKGYSADFMVWNQAGTGYTPAIGEFVARYVWRHRVSLGVRYLIWHRQIRNVEIAGGRWRKYTGPNPHTDHVHVNRYPRTYARPGLPVLSRRLVNAAIISAGAPHPVSAKRLQTALNVAVGAGLTVDGNAGPITRAAVRTWQRQIGRPQTGVLTEAGHARLALASGDFTDQP